MNSYTFLLQAVDAPGQGGAGPGATKLFSVCGSLFAVLCLRFFGVFAILEFTDSLPVFSLRYFVMPRRS